MLEYADPSTYKPLTANDIARIQLGAILQWTTGTSFGKVLKNAPWSKPSKVIRIIFRGINPQGLAYVGFTHQYSSNLMLTQSVREGDVHFRLVE